MVRVGLASFVGYVLGALYGYEHIPNRGDEHAFLQELGGFLILTTLLGGTLGAILEHRIYHRPR